MKNVIIILNLITILMFTSVCFATNYYVLPSGSGSTNGTDWNNAWAGITDIGWGSLGGGDTVYFGAGSYGTLTIGGSGSSPSSKLIFQRATTSDHGTSAGWLPSYDGIVTSGTIYVDHTDDYITVDGATRNGWQINVGDGQSGVVYQHAGGGGATYSYHTFRYIEVDGPGYPYNFSAVTRGIDASPSYGDINDNMTVEYCTFHEIESGIYITNARNALIQNNEFYDMDDTVSNPCCHENIVYISNAYDVVFRYNKAWDDGTETGAEAIFMNGSSGDWDIYGNVFWGTRRFFECDGVACTNVNIYNNTTVDVDYRIIGWINGASGGGDINNNIFYDSSGNNIGGVYGSGTKTNNWYTGSSSKGESNSIAGGSTDPFTSKSSNNFSIVSAVSANLPKDKGLNLSTKFTYDISGNIFGLDGNWDIGAFEYSSGIYNPSPSNPYDLIINNQ